MELTIIQALGHTKRTEGENEIKLIQAPHFWNAMPEVHQTHVVLNAKRQTNLTHPSLSTARTIHVLTFFEFFDHAATRTLFIRATSGMSVQSRPKRILEATSDLSLVKSNA